MNVAILHISAGEFPDAKPNLNIQAAARLMELHGHDIAAVVSVAGKGELKRAAEFLKTCAEAALITGDTGAFRAVCLEQYPLTETMNVFETDGLIYLLDETLSPKFINDTAIPALNSKLKTFYATHVFKTFGATAEELKNILSESMRNKNKIIFRFVETDVRECEVRIRYSNKTQKDVVDGLIGRVAGALKEYIYSQKDETLAETVMNLLALRGKKICLAESFTGGGIAGALIAVPGASATLKEGIVAYSNESKIKRLNVEPRIIEQFGAVSIETVYEMAAHILMDGDCDIAVATTGNAGPATEKPGEEGLFFLAIGEKSGIHIYKDVFQGSRNDVIAYGIKYALFRLYKKLTENSFEELLKQQKS